mmetsp:Transcript_143770/g.349109  ORF Transcript_143770/g.349109 Transcript_143770/m.349109 type:complete len:108 (+) Transcript_143770:431-754(+)
MDDHGLVTCLLLAWSSREGRCLVWDANSTIPSAGRIASVLAFGLLECATGPATLKETSPLVKQQTWSQASAALNGPGCVNDNASMAASAAVGVAVAVDAVTTAFSIL